MLEKAKEITEGWKNVLLKDDEIEKLAAERLEICNTCVFQSENAKKLSNYHTVRVDLHCTKCGCPLISKVRSPSTECPIKKWVKYVSTEKS